MRRVDPPSSPSSGSSSGGGGVKTAVEEIPVVVVGRRGCCMSHVVKLLLQGLGVSPVVWEVAGEAEETALRAEIGKMGPADDKGGRGCPVTLPAVFIGGRLVGGVDHLMTAHISGQLVPNLKQAGALWL
ncbi:Monothiol glutaredoxin-S9 [Platanthera zijinensis]|uniref:Monothiol glutaredoxin-S9 n=1 Tax=Platanthera zijinensis TaxID=2320716 RepID=A0AAP0BQX7_9ASPA